MKRDAKQTAAQRETTYEILNHVDYQDASLVVMGMGKNGLILQDMETELYVEIKVTMKKAGFDPTDEIEEMSAKMQKIAETQKEKDTKVQAEKDKIEQAKAKARRLAQELRDDLAGNEGREKVSMTDALTPKEEVKQK